MKFKFPKINRKHNFHYYCSREQSHLIDLVKLREYASIMLKLIKVNQEITHKIDFKNKARKNINANKYTENDEQVLENCKKQIFMWLYSTCFLLIDIE